MLLCIGPLIDQAITKQWVLDYGWTQPSLSQLLLSCALAVLVNISQFMCLGRFSAVSFQVRMVVELRARCPGALSSGLGWCTGSMHDR